MGRLITNLIFVSVLSLSQSVLAEDWSELLVMKADIEQMAQGLDKEKTTLAHEEMFQTILTRWAGLASRLDPESHNLLVFTLLEEASLSGANGALADDLLGRLHDAIQPQIDAVAAQKDTAQVIPNALLNGLTIYSVGKMGQLCASTKCGDLARKTWAWWFEKKMARMAKVRVPPAGLLNYRPQPLPEVAGYLEYKQSTWKLFSQKVRTWRPRSISSQLLLAGLTGAALAGSEVAYASIKTQKLPPKGMLRLLQVHKACDLSLMLTELAKACSQGHPGCENKEKVQKLFEQIVSDSTALTSSFASLENLLVRDLLFESQDLISRIPVKFRPLFSKILDVQSGDPRPLCYRLALNESAMSHNLNQSGVQFQSKDDKAQKPEEKGQTGEQSSSDKTELKAPEAKTTEKKP